MRHSLGINTPRLVAAMDRPCLLCKTPTAVLCCICKNCLPTEAGKRLRWQLRTEKSKQTWSEKSADEVAAVYEKRKLTNVKRYGGSSPMASAKVRAKVSAAWSKVDVAAVRGKRIKTNRALYGSDWATQSAKVKNKITKAWRNKSAEDVASVVSERKKTHKERYGVASPRQLKEVVKRAAATYKKKTGYAHNMQNPEAVENRKRRHTEQYGVDHPMKRPEVRAKMVETNLFRYGGFGLGSPLLREKIRNTNLRVYGHEVATSNPEIMAKCKATWLQKYGFEQPNKNPLQALKGLKSSFARKEVKVNGKGYTVQGNSEVVLLRELLKRHKTVRTQFDERYPRDKAKRMSWTPDFYIPRQGFVECKSTWTLLMPNAVARNREKARQADESGLKVRWAVVMPAGSCVFLPDDWHTHPNPEALVWHQYYTDIGKADYCAKYVRQIAAWLGAERIKRQTVYVPDKKIAVTFVPHFWSDSQEMARQKAKAEAAGYRLVFLHEDVVRLHAQAARRFCEHLVGLVSKRVYARQCEIVVAPASKLKKFFNAVHIQGAPRGGTAYCLRHNGKVVAAMTFNHTVSSRGSKRQAGVYELTRYATSCSVVGGASRLLAAFVRAASPKSVSSYADNTVFTGGMYQELGFCELRRNSVDYYAWFGGPYRQPKQAFSKAELIKKFGLAVNPDECTEKQLIEELGLRAVKSLGKTKWVRNFIENTAQEQR
jgi:hypothetical protein